MNQPTIRYYAYMAYSTAAGKKTPKYTITKQAGYYPAMAELVGNDGKISFQLLEKIGGSIDAPAMRLQGKKSLNFTGLKNFFDDEGKLTGYAYGYPYDKPSYSGKELPNPFYDYKEDAFLFVMHSDGDSLIPSAMELLVVEGGKVLAGAFCAQLAAGGFDEELTQLRAAAR